jgi:hypothetical protein
VGKGGVKRRLRDEMGEKARRNAEGGNESLAT